MASLTCEFISFDNSSGNPRQNLEPPFDQAVAANVGIFNYEILESISGTKTDGCVNYENGFLEINEMYTALTASQFCALLAPIFGGFGVFFNLVWGLNVMSGILCILAACIQAGTLSMVAFPNVW
jgi:hypothetical protein